MDTMNDYSENMERKRITINALKEQLALAHEQLDSRKNEIDALKIRVEALEQTLKVAGIFSYAPENNVNSEGDFWAGLEESLSQDEALKEQGK